MRVPKNILQFPAVDPELRAEIEELGRLIVNLKDLTALIDRKRTRIATRLAQQQPGAAGQ
jgi:hypothetical protein